MARSRELLQAGLSRGSDTVGYVLGMPCSRNRTRLCELLRCLTACNNILWHAGVNLKEDERDNLGALSVAMVTDACREFTRCSSYAGSRHYAKVLLHRLFTVHSCIVAVEVNYIIVNTEFLLKDLARMRSLKRLSIFGIPGDEPKITECLGDLVRSLDFIEELSLDGYCPSQARTALPGLLLEREGIALGTLDVAGLEMSAPLVRHLTAALIKNNTVTELAVGACVFASCHARPSEWFAEYLGKENGTLRKLALRGCPFRNRPGLETIVEAICTMNTLEELIVEWDTASEAEYMLFSKVVAQNKTLRTLNLPCIESCGNVTATAVRDDCFAALSRRERIGPWLQALSSNHVLLELTIDLQWLTRDECHAFFRAFAQNRTLKTVTVRYLTDAYTLKEVCLIIRKYGLVRKVHIQNYHLGRASLRSISECPEVATLTLSCPHLVKPDDFSNAFNSLASCSHVTSLCVHYDRFSGLVYAALAAYIRGSSVLRNVELYLPGELMTPCEAMGRQRCLYVTRLVQALSANLVINKATLELPRLSHTDCQVLADAIVQSRCLCELSLSTVTDTFCAFFVCCLLPKVERNYTLLHVELRDGAVCNADMAIVQDVARRNSSLVDRAGRFIMGKHDAYCARSIELVSQHPKLVEIVQSKAGVDEAKARAMIRLTLKLPWFTGLDGYMRLAGVVRHRVVCQVPASASCVPNSGMQLDELNHDCWLHIRKYLKLADVVEP